MNELNPDPGGQGAESGGGEERRDEEALSESQSSYRQILESIPGMVFTTRPDGWYDYQSRQWVDYTGISLSEQLGHGWTRLLHPDDAPRALAAWRAALDGRTPYDLEYRVRRRDGAYEWFRAIARPIRDGNGAIVRWFGVAMNIQALKSAQIAHEEGEQRLGWALQAAGGGVWDWDLTTGDAWWSPEMYGIWGIEPGRPIGLEASLAPIDPRDRDAVARAVKDAIDRHEDYRFEFRLCHPERGERWIASRGRPYYDGAGRAVRLLGISLDITQRRHAEEALRRSEARLAGIVDSAMDAIVSVDEGLKIRLFNPAAERMFGLSAEQAMGEPLARLIPERFAAAHDSHVRAFGHTGQGARRMGRAGEILARRADGSEIPAEGSISRTAAGDRIFYTAILRDISERKIAEERLGRSQAELRSFVSQAPIAIAMFDRGMRYLAASARWIRDYGRGREQLVGLCHYEVHPDLPEEWRSIHRECLAGATRRNDEDLWVQADGTRRWLRWAVLPWTDGRGEIGGIVMSAEDITDRMLAAEALRESERRFRRLANAMPQLVWTAQPDGTVDYYNSRAVEYDGIAQRPDGTWSGQPVLHPDDRAPTRSAWETAVATGTSYQCEHRVRMADGELRWHLSRGVPVCDDSGTVVRWYGTATDIQDLKLAQESLQEGARHKDEFLAMLAHELRNPLAPIRNALGILSLKTSGDSLLDAARCMIDRQLRHLVRLVDDLLDVSRVAHGKLALRSQRVDLGEVLGQALDGVRPRLDAAGIGLACSLPPGSVALDADPVRLVQVFQNLLDNACKFTEPGGMVQISTVLEGNEAVVSVSDTGVGIPAERLGEIFELFSQVGDPGRRAQGGLGIGLSLARALVEMHGGAIEAESAGAGHGSLFRVRLPILAPGEAVPESASPAPAVSRGGEDLLVLVADDQPDVADSLAMLLGLSGCRVEVARDGLAAVEAAERLRPDLILLDIGMPGLDGHEACRQIRARPWGRRPIMVALTGWGGEEDRRRSKEAGFDDHLVKPAEPVALMGLVETARTRSLGSRAAPDRSDPHPRSP